ncbi:DUF2332 family protein [Microvirga aerilata]|uniref:DUF2332 family protein n=1 Tax=Microvirga aerilata TaxID=670292 RepID=A0A937D165_9HYPH|nr:DUF2332 family protein [Microvirga aerilata]MBL0406636.1 DUF2332 family protein [Microvirga aerilata]
MAQPAEAVIREAFAEQAEACAERGSPFTSRLCEALARVLDHSTCIGQHVLEWPGRPDARGDSVPLRLVGGLHALVRRGSLPSLAALYPPHPLPDIPVLEKTLAEVLPTVDNNLLPWLDLPPQTNEPMRSAPLMAGLLVVAQESKELPLAVYEVGASAGLLLVLDRYRHCLGKTAVGSPDAPVLIEPHWEGSAPPNAHVRIARRHGSDLEPLNVSSQEDRERLLAYIWADQADRLARVEAALEIAAVEPPRLDGAEAAVWAERTINTQPEAGVARVLFHAVAMQYAGEETCERIAAHAARVGAQANDGAPFAWLRFEADPEFNEKGSLHLTLWPGGKEEVLAIGDTHGERLRRLR